jgi:hypothetical protein
MAPKSALGPSADVRTVSRATAKQVPSTHVRINDRGIRHSSMGDWAPSCGASAIVHNRCGLCMTTASIRMAIRWIGLRPLGVGRPPVGAEAGQPLPVPRDVMSGPAAPPRWRRRSSSPPRRRRPDPGSFRSSAECCRSDADSRCRRGSDRDPRNRGRDGSPSG